MAEQPVSVALVSLGCAKNQVDSEVMLGLLEQAGHDVVEDVEQAEAIIVNTCCFIDDAKQEAIDALLDLAEHKRSGRCRLLICAGCLAQRYGEELCSELPEVDAFVGTGRIAEIPEIIAAALAGTRPVLTGRPQYVYSHDTPRWLSGPSWLRYVKIAEGCSHPCTFCVIPDVRGPYRSRPPDSIVAECRAAAEQGVRELLLISQDTTAYGLDLQPRSSLVQLLQALRPMRFPGWVRLLYLHPDRVDAPLIQAVGELMPAVNYFDIPLQHVAPHLLRAMGRSGTGDTYLALVEQIRTAIPDAALRTTFLLGFPGETDADFQDLLDFTDAARIDRLAGFVFSPQEGTPAYGLPGAVPVEVAQERLRVLLEAQEGISLATNRTFVGQRLRVLLEHYDEERRLWHGRSSRDAPEIDGEVLLTVARTAQTLAPGEFVWAMIEDAAPHDLYGRIP